MPGLDIGLQAEDVTIAELLRPLGYATGQFDKNHFGDMNKYMPTAHGFDELELNGVYMEIDTTSVFCSDLSREAGESMVGTAATVEAWFLLEYAGVWEAKATEENDLPRPAQNWLKEQLSSLGNGRLQFIKQERSVGLAGISFFVALSRKVAPSVYHFQLDAYEDLLDLDAQAIASGDSVYDEFIYLESLYLVCTNGKRDRCCARNGLALFHGLIEYVGEAVWQCTHLGGHRFAPTLLTVPDGAYYGRLTLGDLASFAKSQQDGQLYLDNLRGLCCYDKVTQAADHFLRQKTGLLERSAYRLSGNRRLDERHWVVTFTSLELGQIHRLTLVRELSGAEQVVSCSPIKSKTVSQFQLVNHQISEVGD